MNLCFTGEESQLHRGAPPPCERLVLSHWKKLGHLLSADRVPEHTYGHARFAGLSRTDVEGNYLAHLRRAGGGHRGSLGLYAVHLARVMIHP